MKKTAIAVGLVALVAMPAFAGQTQLAATAGVEPGLYSNSQLVQLIRLQEEGKNEFAINRILANPEGRPLVARLSTTTHASTN